MARARPGRIPSFPVGAAPGSLKMFTTLACVSLCTATLLIGYYAHLITK
jgi:hypothetical protein